MEEFKIQFYATKNGKDKLFTFDVQIIQHSAQLIRFSLTTRGHELQLEKKLMDSKRQPWRVKHSTFEFKEANATNTLQNIFSLLEDHMKAKNDFSYQKKSW
ncbi:MAG: hypothetical protein ABJA37_14725 [Ferruginibacter sp.]